MIKRHQMADGKTVEFFDSIAHRYTSLYREDTPGGFAFIVRKQRLLELFDKAKGKVLDVGCGSGVIVESLTALSCEYWGIDPSPKMIMQCKQNYNSHSNAHFSVGSAERIEFPDVFFDAVICMGVIERVTDENQVLSEMVRVLKPGGTLLITLPNRFSPYFLWRDYIFYPIVSLARPVYLTLTRKENRPTIPSHRLYSAKAYSAKVIRKGCQLTDIRYCGYNFFLSPLDSLFPRLAVAMMKRAEALRHGAFRELAGGIILRAKKQ